MATESKTVDNLQKGGTMVKEGIEKDAYELGGKVKEKLNDGQEYAKNSLHALEEQAKSNPLMTIGISFLVGMVASKFIGSGK
mgnify:CR=1 FL=1